MQNTQKWLRYRLQVAPASLTRNFILSKTDSAQPSTVLEGIINNINFRETYKHIQTFVAELLRCAIVMLWVQHFNQRSITISNIDSYGVVNP
jgi:hypothetical protein